MNIEHKKTTLDDDSILYQKRGDSITKKQDLKNLSGKQKLFYFKDYYLKAVIIAVIVCIIAGTLLNSMFFNRKTSILSIVFLNDSYLDDTEGLQDTLTEYLAPESKNDYVTATDYNIEDYQVQMAYSTQLMAGGIDVVICPQEYFEEASALGVFTDLSEFLPADLYAELSGKMLESREAETDDYGEVISYYDAKPHGIDLTGNTRYEKFGGFDTNPILCVSKNSANTENVIRLIEWFMAADQEAVPAE